MIILPEYPNPLAYMGSLLEHEQMVLTAHYIDVTNLSTHFLAVMRTFGDDKRHKRFLFFSLLSWEFYKYVRSEISEIDLLKNAEYLFICDLDCNLKVINSKRIAIKDLPREYFPAEDTFFND